MHERWFSGLPIRYAEFTFDYGTGHRAIERMEKAPGHRELNRALDEAGRAYLRAKAAVFGARPSEVVTRRIKGWDAVDAKVHRLCVELSAQGTGTKA